MTGLVAVVAAAAGGTAVQTKGRAVSLDMAQSLTVVALLGWGRDTGQSLARAGHTRFLTFSRTGSRASVRLMSCRRKQGSVKQPTTNRARAHTRLLA